MPEEPDQQVGGPMPVVWTERDLYALIGELTIKNRMADLEMAQMRAELATRPVINSIAEDSENADGKP